MTEMTYVNKSIVDLIKKNLNYSRFRWSSAVGLDEKESTLVITLSPENTQNNMQYLAACFEGWATILKTYVIDFQPEEYKKVELCCPKLVIAEELNVHNGHWMRFLYRVLRFTEQYNWFTVNQTLRSDIDKFKKYLVDNHGKLINNYPSKPAASIQSSTTGTADLNEYIVECLLAGVSNGNSSITLHSYFNNLGLPNKGLIVDHQLPVGLFKENNISKATMVFTGQKSAIDLWGFSQTTPNDFYLVELKYNNKMIGMITEAFFYANFMYDLLDKNGAFTLSSDGGKTFRNYNTIYGFKDKEIDRIHAIMMSDKGNLHPAITKALVNVLNQGNQKAIEYSLAEYEVDAKNGIITSIAPK